jgi:hypothetical protein
VYIGFYRQRTFDPAQHRSGGIPHGDQKEEGSGQEETGGQETGREESGRREEAPGY